MVDHNDPLTLIRHAFDWISAGAIVGSLVGYLPPLAAALAIIWYCIQIYESKTFQGWLKRGQK